MSNLDVIRANSKAVLGRGPASSSEKWQYRLLTSQPGVDPRVYSTYLKDIYGLQTQVRETELYDTDKAVYKKFRVCSFRVAEDVAVLNIGDQLVDPNGLYWQLLGQQSAGPGTVAYSIGREIGLIASPDRKGGV